MITRITQYQFDLKVINKINARARGRNWPIVYILENSNQAYVGETTSAVRRIKDHLENKKRKVFKDIFLIEDETFNKSATLDIESKLIEYIAGDGKYKLQNSNRGLRNHNYFSKNKYKIIFNEIWEELKERKVVHQSIRDIENSDLFKFSPYKTLTDDQYEIVDSLDKIFSNNDKSINIINGEPGSGKTILAVYLTKFILSDAKKSNYKVGIVFPQTSLRKTVKKIFKNVEGLAVNMVKGPYDLLKEENGFDLIIVDEAHRLTQRKNLSNYSTFDKASKQLGLDPYTNTQLDWIIKLGKHIVLLHDPNQTVKPSDVEIEQFKKISKNANSFRLRSQQRVLAGDQYPYYIENILRNKQKSSLRFNNYNLLLFKDVKMMIEKIKEKNKEFGLCRTVAGFAWEWISRENSDLFDIEIENIKLKWNSTIEDWINSKNSVNEIGCIHTVQGYDLNYCGVIFGPEIIYYNGQIEVLPERYKDKYGKHKSKSNEELKEYIINIYKTLLTRGIKGTYIYVCDPGLRKYLSGFLESQNYQEIAAENQQRYD